LKIEDFGLRIEECGFEPLRAKSGEAVRALNGDFDGREAHRDLLGHPLAVSQAVLDVQSDGVLDVLHGLFVSVSLAVATLQGGTGNEVAVGVSFDNDGKSEALHAQIIGAPRPSANWQTATHKGRCPLPPPRIAECAMCAPPTGGHRLVPGARGRRLRRPSEALLKEVEV
jgi:hypothetical protein